MANKKVRKSSSASNLKKGTKHSEKTKPSKKLEPVILAIDFRSSEICALVLDPKLPRDPTYRDEFAHNSTCSPLLSEHDAVIKIGEEASETPNNLSAKYLMYLLSDRNNNALGEYPLTDTILANRDKEHKDDYRMILTNLFFRLKDQVDFLLEDPDGNLMYTYNENIVLTIPGHWKADNALRDYYIGLVKTVFGNNNQSDNIQTIPDTEAFAKYVRFIEPRQIDDRDKVLFLDFGAHCMSWSLFTFETVEGEGRRVTADGTDGVAGGVEMWTHHGGKLIAHKLQEQGICDPDQSFLSDMIEDFREQRHLDLPDFGLEVSGGSETEEKTVCLDPTEVNDCFVEGMKAPIKLAREKLNELLDEEKKGSKVRAIITGGSMREDYAQDALFQHHESLYGELPGIDMDSVTYLTDDVEGEHIPLRFRNAYGAALSMITPSDIQEFIDGGAAWAFQAKRKKEKEDSQTPKKKKKEEEEEKKWEWDTEDNAVSLWKGHSKLEWWVNVGEFTDKGAKIKIICDPQFSSRQPKYDPPKIDQLDYYDFHTIGQLKEKMIWIRIVPMMKPNWPIFRIEYADKKSVEPDDEHSYCLFDELDVYFDTADGRVKVRPGNMRGIVESPEDPQDPAPQADQEGEGSDNIYDASPPRSRRRNTTPSHQAADEDMDDQDMSHDSSEELPQPEADENIIQEVEDVAPQQAQGNNRRPSQGHQPHGNPSTHPVPPPPRPPKNAQQGNKRSVREESESPSQSGKAPKKRPRPEIRKITRSRRGVNTASQASSESQLHPFSAGQPRGNVNTPQPSLELFQVGTQSVSESIPRTLRSTLGDRSGSGSQLQPSSAGQSGHCSTSRAGSGQARENTGPGNRPSSGLQHTLADRPSPSPSPSVNLPSGQSTGGTQGSSSARPEAPDHTTPATSTTRKLFAKRGGRKGR